MVHKSTIALAALCLSGAFSAVASAADLSPAPGYTKAPLPAPSWSGFYIGVNGGYVDPSTSHGQTDATVLSTSTFVANGASQAAGASSNMGKGRGGLFGGEQVGWNYAATPALLLGIETDIQTSPLRQTANLGSLTQVPGSGAPALATWQTQIAASRNVDYLGTLRARVGSTVVPDLLFYGTGGLAYGRVSSSTSITQGGVTGSPAPSTISASFGGMRVGWTAGAGAEWTFVRNWTAKFEYLHYDLGSISYPVGTLAFDMTPTPFNGTGISSIASTSSARFNGDLVRVGVNYRFH
jgi:outer membrane immunogenic protein